VKGRRPKLFYGTQVGVAPPTFVFFANDAGSIHFSYRRYLENQIREVFAFHGTPIKLVFRNRESVRLPRRRASRSHSPVSKGPSGQRPAAGGRRPKR
jgi:GTP-binding protein